MEIRDIAFFTKVINKKTNNMAKYFIDTEFHEYHKRVKLFGIIPIGKPIPTIDLISIGIKSEDGREYYAISRDFNIKDTWNSYQIKKVNNPKAPMSLYPGKINSKDYWLRDNVLLSIYADLVHSDMRNYVLFTLSNIKNLIKNSGKSNKQIAAEIIEFCNPKIRFTNADTTTQWKEMGNPIFYGYYSDYDWVVFAQLFGKMIDLPNGFPMYCIDLKQTFDEETIRTGVLDLKDHPEYPKQTNEHNALADAKWNFELYKFLQKL